MREIVTLQFGAQSNYIGTHLLNVEHLRAQKRADGDEDICGDILFRSLDSGSRVHAQPLDEQVREQRSARVVSFDRTGSSSLEPHSKVDATANTWSMPATVIEQDQFERHSSLQALESYRSTRSTTVDSMAPMDLSGLVRRWSDYLEAPMQQRSIVQLEGIHANTTFDTYSAGVSVASADSDNAMFDRIRYFVEECDSIAGFHCFVDVDDGFAGLGSSLLQDVRDEFRAPLLTYSVSAGDNASNDSTSQLNQCLAFSSLYESSSTLVPLSLSRSYDTVPPKFRQHPELYHSSALTALAVQSSTIAYRCKDSTFSLRDLISALQPRSSLKLSFLSFALEPSASTFLQPLSSDNLASAPFLTNLCDLGHDPRAPAFGSFATLQGVADDDMERCFYDLLQRSNTKLSCCVAGAVHLPVSFPNMFSSQLTHEGRVRVTEGLGSVSVMSHLSSSADGVKVVSGHQAFASRCLSRHIMQQELAAAGFELDDVSDVDERLQGISDDYKSMH